MVIRSLFQIFIRSSSSGVEVSLNCDECFVVMEYFVDLALEGIPQERIKQALLQHINHCPDCKEHHIKRLKELEDQMNQIKYPE